MVLICLIKSFLDMDDFQIIILAAGKGTRMGESDIPKVLHKLHGQPLIKHVLSNIHSLENTAKPIVVVGYKREHVIRELGSQCVYAVQEEQLGTGHAVLASKDLVTAQNIIVLYGDMPFITAHSIEQLMRAHTQDNSAITMFTTRVPNFEGQFSGYNGYGRILRDAQGSLQKIRELKDANQTEKEVTEINPGIYAFNAEWLWKYGTLLQSNNAQGELYLTDMVEIAITNNFSVTTLHVPLSEVVGINTKTELEAAHNFALAFK